MRRSLPILFGALSALALAHVASAQQSFVLQDDAPRFPIRNTFFQEFEDGSILAADVKQQIWFQNYNEYARSAFFQEHGMRCGSDDLLHPLFTVSTGDCNAGNTNPAAQYDPSGSNYEIQVVVHVLHRTNGVGNVSDALINSQIAVLNEDFRAMAGSNGAGGDDTNIQFKLAGITRTASNSYYSDRGNYWNALAWDTTKYLNIYTNTAGGNLGYAYVPSGGGVVGNTWDRVVLYWAAVGKPAPYGAPYHLGRSATHEVGHYLGLYHTFDGGCAPAGAPACYSSGDLICDTNSEASPNFSPCSRTTCGTPDPTNNYMDYSDDVCMNAFTGEQARRMRCTLENFRVDLAGTGSGGNPPDPATSPSPSNNATLVSVEADLSWSAGAGATSHDVYFGTDSSPDAGEFQGNQTETSYALGTLSEGTTYYWRIDEVNGDGTTTGSVWSFTTETTGGGAITLSASKKGRRRVSLSWSGNSGNVTITRNGATIATNVSGSSYTDSGLGRNPSGTYVYEVCDSSVCSNPASVTF